MAFTLKICVEGAGGQGSREMNIEHRTSRDKELGKWDYQSLNFHVSSGFSKMRLLLFTQQIQLQPAVSGCSPKRSASSQETSIISIIILCFVLGDCPKFFCLFIIQSYWSSRRTISQQALVSAFSDQTYLQREKFYPCPED